MAPSAPLFTSPHEVVFTIFVTLRCKKIQNFSKSWKSCTKLSPLWPAWKFMKNNVWYIFFKYLTPTLLPLVQEHPKMWGVEMELQHITTSTAQVRSGLHYSYQQTLLNLNRSLLLACISIPLSRYFAFQSFGDHYIYI